ncbi:DUF2721 domain-containing protein [Salinispira pacifica]|uniref:II family cellulose-binding protein n=1 Tax=Salinispira pacifica TaxID=1307761 RepID=V5WKG1_9SPIO|nr:DUF2721 domain-containing protein [Salinispira pacifica]AHC16130.1 hypothetical protein L21SP2_2780 [Salinispira pacifica]
MIDITTPALLFPALSLLLLAYTNRFITLANLIRQLHRESREEGEEHVNMVYSQIRNLQRRIFLIKIMQMFGVLSLLLCVVTMFLLFFSVRPVAEVVFALSLVSMITSLGYSLAELRISVTALNLQLSDLEGGCPDHP